jgi:hypothetical protein
MSPFSIVPPSHFGRRPRVRLSVRARAVSDITARPFVPSAKADALLVVAAVALTFIPLIVMWVRS